VLGVFYSCNVEIVASSSNNSEVKESKSSIFSFLIVIGCAPDADAEAEGTGGGLACIAPPIRTPPNILCVDKL
jgi:hypothetical protein